MRMYIELSFIFSKVSMKEFLFFLPTQLTPFVRTSSIESLHLSFFLSESLFVCQKKRIWLRITHFFFRGFSEFESYHLVGFHTKAQANLSPSRLPISPYPPFQIFNEDLHRNRMPLSFIYIYT